MRKILFLLLVGLSFSNLYAGTSGDDERAVDMVIFFATVGASAIYAFGLWLYVLMDVWKNEDLTGKFLFTTSLIVLHVFTVVAYIVFKKKWNVIKISILFYTSIVSLKLVSLLS
ncbi:MAG: hypothetical protein QG567_2467 [Campylobacterota bacterium]|nr:hypothetical protein [Campylobacterota bacterium]